MFRERFGNMVSRRFLHCSQLERQSKKMAKDVSKNQKKVAEFIKKNDAASARIYAENAIRAKNESLSLLRLSARIGAVSARVETALRMKALTSAMSSVTKGMDSVLATMDASKISSMMDKFEEQFESLDVRAGFMESAIDSATATGAPATEVDSLIAQVADAEKLDLVGQFAEIPTHAAPAPASATAAPAVPLMDGMPAPPSGPAGRGGGAGAGGGTGAGGYVGGSGGSGASVADSLQARLDALRG